MFRISWENMAKQMEDNFIRDFYFQLKGHHCDLVHHVEVTREYLSEIDGDLHQMKLLMDAFSVRVKDVDQPYKEMKVHERLVPYHKRFDSYKEDNEFMKAVREVLGRRPFWQEVNGLFYCQFYNPHIGRSEDIPLGFEKAQVIEKIQRLEKNE